jgi:hypothetical protein
MLQKDRKDVFHASLVEGANFGGKWDIPFIPSYNGSWPEKMIAFKDAVSLKKEFRGWVHFYQDDYKFEAVWNNPTRYLDKLKKFEGVISPDFSLYRDMPLAEQVWNVYRNHALGYWFSKNGIHVIPNVRWGDESSYEFCYDGVVYNSIVSVGTHGCLKLREDRKFFRDGLAKMLSKLSPKTIIVYGCAPDELFVPCKEAGIMIKQFDSSFHENHHKKAA